ncbi:MAG: ABC transporter permease [Chloroflexi bacterium]|nr:ABC transporter permease [Chloroflexota bacterium]
MTKYLIRRLLLIIPTLIGASIIISGLVRLLPGDAVDVLVAEYRGSAADLEVESAKLRAELGLDQSWPEQYANWLWGVLQGDFGHSLQGGQRSVLDDLAARIPVTVELGLIALLVGTGLAIPIGVYSAIRQDTTRDYIARSFAIIFLAVPSFWLATLVISIVIPVLDLPLIPIRFHGFLDQPIENLKQMWVPGVILGVALAGGVMRLTRAQMLEVLRQDYVRTAWAKGLRERTVVTRHALRNSLIPIVTLIGIQVPFVIGGSVVLEFIFVLPGMGLRLLRALGERDVPVILGINMIVVFVVVLANLLVDITYSILDPRIRYG